jgi:hypothetical protein
MKPARKLRDEVFGPGNERDYFSPLSPCVSRLSASAANDRAETGNTGTTADDRTEAGITLRLHFFRGGVSDWL